VGDADRRRRASPQPPNAPPVRALLSSRRPHQTRRRARAIDTSESKKTPQVLLPTRRRLATRRDFAERGVSRAEWLRIARTRSRPR
jgi:hypothetical protein